MPGLDSLPLPSIQQVVFVAIALLTITGAMVTVFAPNLFHNALGLVATLFGVAGMYALLEAEFLAVSQVFDLCRRHFHSNYICDHAYARHDVWRDIAN